MHDNRVPEEDMTAASFERFGGVVTAAVAGGGACDGCGYLACAGVGLVQLSNYVLPEAIGVIVKVFAAWTYERLR